MKFHSYDEIDPHLVSWLNYLGLNYSFTPEMVENVRKIDSRIPKEYAWYVVSQKKPICQAAYLVFPVLTVLGTKDIGVPQMICSLPSMSGKGNMRKLMDYLHNLFLEKNYEFSILTTSKHLKAYKFYLSLGYQDFISLPLVYGKIKHKIKYDIQTRPVRKDEMPILHQLFLKHTKNLFGFVQRQSNFLEVRVAWNDLKFSDVILILLDKSPIGYAWVQSTGQRVIINELVINNLYLADCLASIAKNNELLVRLHPCEDTKKYLSLGLNLENTWSIIMIKIIDQGLSIEDVQKLFSITSNKFEALKFDLF